MSAAVYYTYCYTYANCASQMLCCAMFHAMPYYLYHIIIHSINLSFIQLFDINQSIRNYQCCIVRYIMYNVVLYVFISDLFSVQI